jgi:hypothetical protein
MPLLTKPGPEGDYFIRICDEELGPWFDKRGFQPVEQLRSTTLAIWRRGQAFAEFKYWPEDTPDFPVMVGIGFIKDMPFGFFGPRKPMLHGLGLWEVVDGDDARSVLKGTFRNQNDLRRLLGRIRDEALPYAEPLFEDRRAMTSAIRNRKRVKAR